MLQALRVSMEEQRARQEDEARKVAQQSAEEAGVKPVPEGTRSVLPSIQICISGFARTEDNCPMCVIESNEEALLKQALEMSMQPEPAAETPSTDFAMMSEDEQIAYAMRMSLQAEGTLSEQIFHITIVLLEQN